MKTSLKDFFGICQRNRPDPVCCSLTGSEQGRASQLFWRQYVFFPGEVEGSASCAQVISAAGLNRPSVIHVRWFSRSSESMMSANKPGDVFIPSHSADPLAPGKTWEDLSTWHSWPIYLQRLPRDPLSPVFLKTPSQGLTALQLPTIWPNIFLTCGVYACVHMDCGKEAGPAEGKREVCLREEMVCCCCLNRPVWFGCAGICLIDSPRICWRWTARCLSFFISFSLSRDTLAQLILFKKYLLLRSLIVSENAFNTRESKTAGSNAFKNHYVFHFNYKG